MHDELPFIHEIRTRPENDDARLIYADFLEDQGDARGELIRVQIELHHLPPAAPERASLLKREDELLATHGEAWLEPLRRLGAEGLSIRCFERGLIERVRLSWRDFAQQIETLCELAPALSCVAVSLGPGELHSSLQPASVRLPPQITAIDFRPNKQLSAGFLAQLGDAPWLAQLRSMNLQMTRIGNEGAAQLAQFHLPAIERLDLGMCGIDANGLAALVENRTLWRLRGLSLNLNPIKSAGLQQMLAAPMTAVQQWELEELELAYCSLDTLAAERLAASTTLPRLKRLNVRANKIQAAGWTQLSNSPLAKQLERLDTRNNDPSPSAHIAERFANATVLRS